MFGKKGLADFDEYELEHLALGYLTATDEIKGLVKWIREERKPNAKGQELTELEAWDNLLVQHHNRLLTTGKQLPPPSHELEHLLGEAQAIEVDVSKIAEALYGYDEARVSGLLMVEGSLEAKLRGTKS